MKAFCFLVLTFWNISMHAQQKLNLSFHVDYSRFQKQDDYCFYVKHYDWTDGQFSAIPVEKIEQKRFQEPFIKNFSLGISLDYLFKPQWMVQNKFTYTSNTLKDDGRTCVGFNDMIQKNRGFVMPSHYQVLESQHHVNQIGFSHAWFHVSDIGNSEHRFGLGIEMNYVLNSSYSLSMRNRHHYPDYILSSYESKNLKSSDRVYFISPSILYSGQLLRIKDRILFLNLTYSPYLYGYEKNHYPLSRLNSLLKVGLSVELLSRN